MAVYLYARVSTDKQENGRKTQVARLEEWARGQGYEDCQLFVDEDVSAMTTPISRRKEGKLLWDRLEPGDVLCMTKVDRGFRSWAHAAEAYNSLRALGVQLRFADMDIDLATPQGELFFAQIVAFAQYESRMHGQRKREIYAHKRKQKLPYNSLRPWGWLAVKGRDGRLSGWAPCEQERQLGERVAAMRATGMSWLRIARDLCVANVQKPAGRKTSSRYYHSGDLAALVAAAAAGYPIRPQGSWPAPGSGRKRRGGKSDASQLSPATCDR